MLLSPDDIRALLHGLTERPGVYKMLDKGGVILYVGKAKNLKKRVSSYFRVPPEPRVQNFIHLVCQVETIITKNEKEALLLENTLIKAHRPRYNVIFKDDKSYPYIFISAPSERFGYPKMVHHRGPQREKGNYFGPYPSGLAVKQTLVILQKLFKLRQCSDSFFAHRKRPCLQYQIKRCSAPCVNFITQEAYQQDVQSASLFLEGHHHEILETLVNDMEKASEQKNYELAATLRDKIVALKSIQEQQHVVGSAGEVDVLIAIAQSGWICIEKLWIREGKVLGNEAILKNLEEKISLSEVLQAYIMQHYVDQPLSPLEKPREIILNAPLSDEDLIKEALSEAFGRKCDIRYQDSVRQQRQQWCELALTNAKEALKQKISAKTVVEKRWQAFLTHFGFNEDVKRMECFDISHMQGEATVASCVVFSEGQPLKSAYRSYHLEQAHGDDYAAMREVLSRCYTKRKAREETLPDIIIVDGGKGQLSQARKILRDDQILDVILLGIAKGPGRKAGLETIYILPVQDEEGEEVVVQTMTLPPFSPVLHVLQSIRDEAHRFAVKAHRKRRKKDREHSPLLEIEGMGPKRKQRLMNYFGGKQGLLGASVQGIAKVPGISVAMAEKIYAVLHGEE